MSNGLTPADIRLLEEVQKDATLSSSELAERTGSSQSACWRRLQRLKDEGYIRAQVALIDETKVRCGFYIFLRLKVGDLETPAREELMRTIELTPEIVECYWTFGDMDMMLKIMARDMDWYRSFLLHRIRSLPGLSETASIVSMTEVKRTTAIPILAD
jgi:Lrp/AsnC family transcriptional regulator